jgi:hypothetical protein
MKNSNSLRIFNPEKRLINRIKKESINKIKRAAVFKYDKLNRGQ